jgi:glycosyltransferase involved in cell wall biosynthesis
MKILFINDYIEKIGGCETYLYRLMSKLNNEGHECILVGGVNSENQIKKYIRSIYNSKFRKQIKRNLQSYQPDIVFTRSINTNISPAFMIEVKKKGIPIIQNTPRYEPYTLSGYRSFLQIPIKAYRIFMAKNYVDAWIAQSDFMYDFLKKQFPHSKIFKIYHPRFWEPIENISTNKYESKFHIVYVGRLERGKGVHVLIESARILKDRKCDFHVSIVGTGEEIENLIELVKEKNLTTLIELKGYIDHDNIKDIYKYANVMVHPCPSFIETFGLSIVEALSQGVPVITTKIGAQQEHIKNGYNGFLVEPNDPEQIANKLELLIKNKELLKNMSFNAIVSTEKYDFDLHVKKLLEVFYKIKENYI